LLINAPSLLLNCFERRDYRPQYSGRWVRG
jgi:hypothetical protein